MEEHCRRDAIVADDLAAMEGTKDPCNEVQFPHVTPSPSEVMFFHLLRSTMLKAVGIANTRVDLHGFRESHDWLITTEHTRETAIARAVRCLQALVLQRSDLWDERCDATQEKQQRPDTDL